MTASQVKDGIAVLRPINGNTVQGTIAFHQDGDAVLVMGELTGLQPNAVLGFHIHEYGDCSAPDGSSAGGHYTPDGKRHGAPTAAEHHLGDLGNVRADASGRATVNLRMQDARLVGSDAMLLGRALVVHEGPDDLHSQPSGNSGARIGCGVIGVRRVG
jgi:Cu-Zn family superoxide dismutase